MWVTLYLVYVYCVYCIIQPFAVPCFLIYIELLKNLLPWQKIWLGSSEKVYFFLKKGNF